MFVIVKQESFATVRVGILKLLFPVLLLQWGEKRFEVFVYMKVICLDSFLTCLNFFLLLWMFCFLSQEIFMVTLCCLCCSAKACLNVFLTDASSYLPRAVVGFKPRGHRVCDPLKHMLLVLPPSTMTEPRPVSVRSSLMADKVKGHIWARMDFPQLYTGVCTSTRQITTMLD